MQINEIANKGLKREYEIIIGAADIDAKLDFLLKDLSHKIRMPGFRPGKAPPSLLRKLHGKSMMGQVLEETVTESTEKVLKEKDITPALQPKIEIKKYEEDSDLEFTMAIEIMPVIETGDFSKLKLERLVAPAEDKDVDAYLERLAENQKRFEAAAKTYKAKAGDAVMIDFVGKMDGTAFDGGTGEGVQLELGSGSFIPGFEEQLIGAKAGNEKKVEVTFPENYGSSDLAGKAATFDVTVKEVQKPVAAKVDDDLAVAMGLQDLKALKETIKGQIERSHAQMSRARLKRVLLDTLAAQYDFDIPEGMVDIEYRQIWEQIKRDAIQSGEAMEDELKDKEEPDSKEERAEFRALAERRVRLGLLLSEVGRDNNVQIRQEEVNRMVAEEARRYPGQEKEVMEFYRNNEQAMAQLRAPIYEDKVVDFILELAEVKDRTVTREALEQALESEDDAAVPQSGSRAGAKKTSKKPAAKKAAAPAKEKPAAKKASVKTSPAKKAPAAVKKPAAKKAPAKKK